eukprot:gene11100-7726_t
MKPSGKAASSGAADNPLNSNVSGQTLRMVNSAQGLDEERPSTGLPPRPSTGLPGWGGAAANPAARLTGAYPPSLPKVFETSTSSTSAVPSRSGPNVSSTSDKSFLRHAVCPPVSVTLDTPLTRESTQPEIRFDEGTSQTTPLPPAGRPQTSSAVRRISAGAGAGAGNNNTLPVPSVGKQATPPPPTAGRGGAGPSPRPPAIDEGKKGPTMPSGELETSPEAKPKKQITISPHVTEYDEHQNTATYTLLPPKDGVEESARHSAYRRGSRRNSRHRHRFSQDVPEAEAHGPDGPRRPSILFREFDTSERPFSTFGSGCSSPVRREGTHHPILVDHSLGVRESLNSFSEQRQDSPSQPFPHRAAFHFNFKERGENDSPATDHSISSFSGPRRSVSFASPEGSAVFQRRKSKAKSKAHRRRSRRRSSLYRHRSTSILDLPDGGYVRGSPFRRDRFADLGPCPATEHKRIFCYNTFGEPSDPALIMINGMGSSCTLWPEDLCMRFAEKGVFVVRFDNRDVGLSSHWDGYPAFPMYKAALMGILSKGSPPYGLGEMAQDTLDLMDYLGIYRAHVLGISMGGMIAQRVALAAPDRILSLTLIATHCPGHRVESPSLKLLMSNFLDAPKSNSLDAIVDFYVRRRQAIIGDYNADTEEQRKMLRKSIIRAPGDRKATRRHFWAVQNESSKTREVRALSEQGKFPVLIIHGKKDNLIPVANAKANAGLWVGSELRIFDKMGHAIAEELHEPIVAAITRNMERGVDTSRDFFFSRQASAGTSPLTISVIVDFSALSRDGIIRLICFPPLCLLSMNICCHVYDAACDGAVACLFLWGVKAVYMQWTPSTIQFLSLRHLFTFICCSSTHERQIYIFFVFVLNLKKHTFISVATTGKQRRLKRVTLTAWRASARIFEFSALRPEVCGAELVSLRPPPSSLLRGYYSHWCLAFYLLLVQSKRAILSTLHSTGSSGMPEYAVAAVGNCPSLGIPIHIAYEVFDPPRHEYPDPAVCPCMLLFAPIGMPGAFWPDRFCGYIAAEGYRAIRFDQRNTGRSTHTRIDKAEQAPKPEDAGLNRAIQFLLELYQSDGQKKDGYGDEPLYSLEDLARDALELLTHLQIQAAHLASFSLGGLVAQTIAVRSPLRVCSLSLIASFHCFRPAAVHVTWIPRILRHARRTSVAWFPPPDLSSGVYTKQQEAVLQRQATFMSNMWALMGDAPADGETYAEAMAILRRAGPLDFRGAMSHIRAVLGMPRMDADLRATISSLEEDRVKLWRTSNDAAPPFYIPTVVVNGTMDRLSLLPQAVAVQKMIPGSRLVRVEGMGHRITKECAPAVARVVLNNALLREKLIGRKQTAQLRRTTTGSETVQLIDGCIPPPPPPQSSLDQPISFGRSLVVPDTHTINNFDQTSGNLLYYYLLLLSQSPISIHLFFFFLNLPLSLSMSLSFTLAVKRAHASPCDLLPHSIWPSAVGRQAGGEGSAAPTRPPHLSLSYNTFGSSSDPCVLLLQDFAAPGLYWHQDLCAAIAAQGFFVVRYDQRDTGKSTSFPDRPLSRLQVGLSFLLQQAGAGGAPPSYTLQDLCRDATGLLDALGVPAAHIVGFSMGAAVAQQMLVDYPARVLSACLIATLPASIQLAWLVRSPSAAHEPVVDKGAKAFADSEVAYYSRRCGGYSFPAEGFRELALWDYDRHPPSKGALKRHIAAVTVSPDRTPGLRRLNACCQRRCGALGGSRWLPLQLSASIAKALLERLLTERWRHALQLTAGPSVPAAEAPHHIPITLLHGGKDDVTPPSFSEELVRDIPGAQLVIYPRMGHFIPPELFLSIAGDIATTANATRRQCPQQKVLLRLLLWPSLLYVIHIVYQCPRHSKIPTTKKKKKQQHKKTILEVHDTLYTTDVHDPSLMLAGLEAPASLSGRYLFIYLFTFSFSYFLLTLPLL